jgi:3-oxoacyl-[acyl-carrier protein] reductase
MDFSGKTVLVTGATRGIGEAIGTFFIERGATAILTGADGENVARLNADAPDAVTYLQADFTDDSSLEALLNKIKSLERLDVCVNNAGINVIKRLEEVDISDFDRVTSVNYRAPYLISQAAASVMTRGGGGRIVNVASIWSVATKEGRSPYCASKAGLAGMTRAIATDLARHNILVNAISPGFVQTELTRQSLSESEMEQLAAQVPLGRFAEPDEIARMVGFLASEENTYLTGQNIVVDGGFTNV